MRPREKVRPKVPASEKRSVVPPRVAGVAHAPAAAGVQASASAPVQAKAASVSLAQARAGEAASGALGPPGVLSLQQTAGNRATRQLLQDGAGARPVQRASSAGGPVIQRMLAKGKAEETVKVWMPDLQVVALGKVKTAFDSTNSQYAGAVEVTLEAVYDGANLVPVSDRGIAPEQRITDLNFLYPVSTRTPKIVEAHGSAAAGGGAAGAGGAASAAVKADSKSGGSVKDSKAKGAVAKDPGPSKSSGTDSAEAPAHTGLTGAAAAAAAAAAAMEPTASVSAAAAAAAAASPTAEAAPAAAAASTTSGQAEKAAREMKNKIASTQMLEAALDALASGGAKNAEVTVGGFTLARKGKQIMIVLYRKMSIAEARSMTASREISRVAHADPYKWFSESAGHSLVFKNASSAGADVKFKIYVDADLYLKIRGAVQPEHGASGASQNRFHQENLGAASPQINIGIEASAEDAFNKAILKVEPVKK